MKLDNVDLSIIKELQRDSRLSMRELGRKNQIVSPVRHRACQTA